VIRVLIVDDDFMVAKVHAAFVASTPGFTVVGLAHSGAEALTSIRQLHPDLVLLDIYLPDMTGLEVLERMRAASHDVDVIVVTAARDVDDLKRALRGGALYYLVKPFERETLTQRLQEYAQRHAQLSTMHEVEQEHVDRVLGSTAVATRGRLPKGLSAETAGIVRRVLVDAAEDGLSASECAERAGLSRVSARRYLEYLVARGEAAVRLKYGTAGRPERRFHVTMRRGRPGRGSASDSA
jgi:response regulator of citrate/malate metabolism